MKVRAGAHIPYKIGTKTGTHHFRIINDLKNTIIVGTDLLAEWKATIDFDIHRIRIPYSEAVPFTIFTTQQHEQQVGTVVVAENVVIPPLSVKNIEVKLNSNKQGTFTALMPKDLAIKRGVTMRNGTVTSTGRLTHTMAQVVNYSPVPVKLHTNSKVGLLFNDEQDASLMRTINMIEMGNVHLDAITTTTLPVFPLHIQLLICEHIVTTKNDELIQTAAMVNKQWRRAILKDK
jgi:hypothetical protein